MLFEAWTLVIVGCGTVGYWAARNLCRSPLASALGRAVMVDHDEVSDTNAYSCPNYRGRSGLLKPHVLGRLMAGPWGLAHVELLPLCHEVERVDWAQLIDQADGLVCVLMGLDNWDARVRAVRDVRNALVDRPDADVLTIMCAVDRSLAQVSVFGMGFGDLCPACGLASLPHPEPCILFNAQGELVRGNLRREARAAAQLASEIIASHLADGGSQWTNTKSNLTLAPHSGQVIHRMTRQRTRSKPCFGAHEAPINWRDVIPIRAQS